MRGGCLVLGERIVAIIGSAFSHRAVLGELGDDDARDQADDDAAKDGPRNLGREEDANAQRREDRRDDRCEPHAEGNHVEELLEGRLVVELPAADKGDARERRKYAEAVDPEGEGDGGL